MYKPGDYVVITANTGGHDFAIDQVVVVDEEEPWLTEEDIADLGHTAFDPITRISWLVLPEEMRRCTELETALMKHYTNYARRAWAEEVY